MANSLQTQVLRRLLASFVASALIVVAATVWFQSRAEKRAALSREASMRGNFLARIADLHLAWQGHATHVRQVLEFTRILESRRPELWQAFFLAQSGDSETARAVLVDPRGEFLLQYGLESEPGSLARRLREPEPWWYDRQHQTLYHVLKGPVWLGREGTGQLFLLQPVDNALLGQLDAPDTDLYLLLDGRPVASSLGQRGIERFAAVDGKTAVGGMRFMQVSIPWVDPLERSSATPTLVVRRTYRESLSRSEIAAMILAALALLAATSRFVLGNWISGIIGRIVDLKGSSDSFARERAPASTADLSGSRECRDGDDELEALKSGMRAMMQTVVESERRLAERGAALRKEHEFSASLVATAPVIIVLLDPQGSIQYVNPYFEQLAGCRLEQIKGREWFSMFLPAPEQQRVRAIFATAVQGGAVRGNINRIVTRTGEERVIEWSAKPMRDAQENVTALLSIGRDITESKDAEEKYKNILQTAIDGFWTTDAQGRLLEVNAAYCRMSGYSREELLGMSIPDLEAAENPAATARHIEKIIAHGSDRFETRHRRKDGTVFDADASVQFSSQRGGMFICFLKDITKRKRVEMALLESEERLRQAMDATHDGLWDRNLATDEVYYSPNYFRMLGYDPGELSGGSKFWAELIHPEDREATLRANRDCIENRVQTFEVEFRMRSKSDGWIWILGRGKAVQRDRSGKALRMVGTHVDLTAIKLAEAQLLSALAEKEMLLREIHHRVKNNLQVIGSLLYLQAEQVTEPQVLKLLQESRDRIKSMALVHEKLFGARDLSRVDLGDYLKSLAGYLVHVHDAGRRGVRIVVDVRNVTLGVDAAAPCGLIAHELISNALKYAFPGGRPGTVRLAAARGPGGMITLNIEDDGVGLPAGLDVERIPSLGLRLVRQLVGQLHGRMSVVTNGGTRYALAFPESIENAKEDPDGA